MTAWFFGWTSDSILRGRRWVWPAVTTILNAAVCLTLVNILLYKHITGHFVLFCESRLALSSSVTTLWRRI